MSFQNRQVAHLRDGQNHLLGIVEIDQIDGDIVFGRFTPGSDYPGVASLFAEYVAAANEQVLSVVGELDQTIGALGLHLLSLPQGGSLPAIYDVQIGDGTISFRTKSHAAEDRSPILSPTRLVG
jgi:hypothetical protein